MGIWTWARGAGRPAVAAVAGLALLAGCGPGSPFAMGRAEDPAVRQPTRTDGYESVAVNRYLWYASLDVLSFLPVESADPFTGVIVTGYGVPPGGSAAYRATIYVSDPALDARALNVALFTRSGAPVAAGTAQAVEDAILSRARQLRMQDRRL